MAPMMGPEQRGNLSPDTTRCNSVRWRGRGYATLAKPSSWSAFSSP